MPFLLVVGGRYDPLSSERRYDAGDFQNQDEALAAAQKIIQRSLLECWREGMNTQELFESYRSSGEFPFMFSHQERDRVGSIRWRMRWWRRCAYAKASGMAAGRRKGVFPAIASDSLTPSERPLVAA
jgi:hypothetical protein